MKNNQRNEKTGFTELHQDSLTPQELELQGATYDKKHRGLPYVPIGVQKGVVSVEDCGWRRQNILRVDGAIVSYFLPKGAQGSVRLMPLNLDLSSDNYKKTIEDPVLVKVAAPEIQTKDLRNQFPFKRREVPLVEIENE